MSTEDQPPIEELPILDISQGPIETDPVFASDPAFLVAAQKRQEEMVSFMQTLKIQTMRTRMTSSAGVEYKVLVQL